MSLEPGPADEALPLRITRQIDALCDEFEAALRHCRGVAIEPYVDRVEAPGRDLLVEELALLALGQLREEGAKDPLAELLAANPTLRSALERISHGPDGAATAQHNRGLSPDKVSGLIVRCPQCHSTIDLIVDSSLIDIDCPNCGSSFSLINEAEHTRDAAALTKIAHFELVERLGMGEFGTVWKARDTILDRTVALKIPRRTQLDAASIEKFMREARAAAQLRHPNIVSTHEVGRHADTLYIVSDYIRGVSLADMIADHRLGVRDSVAIASKVADALEHAHRSGVIHRDLKPSNIQIDDHGEPHLMDFGLAKRKETEVTITTEGAILGTPAYMSPEQARGEASHVDGRSDVYSLGVILFQLLTGELPFRGSMRMLLQKVINDDPPAARTLDGRVPKDLDTICLKCMEKDPARRYATASDLAADLRRYMAGEPVAARRTGAVGRTLRWAKRNRAISILLATTILTLLTAAIVSSYFAWRSVQNAMLTAQKATEVTDTLYDSLLQEMRLTHEVRKQGYGVEVRKLVDRARSLSTPRVDKDELRRQLVLTMGDFVAYNPTAIDPLEAQVTAICLSGEGEELLVGFNDGRLCSYDARSGVSVRELERFDGPVQAITVTAGDDRLVAADERGAVRVWQRAKTNWALVRTFQTTDSPWSLVASSDGQIVLWMKGPLLEAWNVDTGDRLRTFPTESDWTIRNAAIDTVNRRVAAGFHRDAVDAVGWALWNLDTGERLHDVEMPSLGNTYPNGIDLAKNGSQLAIGFDEALLVYDLNDYQRTNLHGFDSIKTVAFSPNSCELAAANIRGRISIWNASTKRQLATLTNPRLTASRDELSFSADGTLLAASNANAIRVWDLTRATEKVVLAGHNGGIPCAAFHPDGQVLATGGKDNAVRFWNPRTGLLIGAVDLEEAVQALAFSEDGELLAVGSTGVIGSPHLRMIETSSREIVYEHAPSMEKVHSLMWAQGPTGRRLVGCGSAGVALWNVPSDEPLKLGKVLELNRNWCLATVVDPATRFVVWTEDDFNLQAWDIAAGRQKPLHAPFMLQGWHGLALWPYKNSIIYVSKSGVAEVWDVEKDRRVDTIGEPGTFTAPHIALSPDGQWLAALRQADAVSVWHTPTGDHVFSLRPETGNVWSLAWDAASEQLAVGQSDGGLAVWQLPGIEKKLVEAGLPWREEP